MISIFAAPKVQKPVAKAVYAFDEQSGSKWVPLNKSFVSLAKIILQAAADRMGVANVAVILRCVTHQGYRHLLLNLSEQDGTGGAFGVVEEFIISNETTLTPLNERFGNADAVSVPMDYQGQRLGYVLADIYEKDFVEHKVHPSARSIEAELNTVAGELVSIITRYQTRYRAIFIYGDQNYWVGNSAALLKLDKKIEQLRDALKPVLISGNKGTGKRIAARSLHCARHQSILPFIESSCSDWEEYAAASIMKALYTYAKGGTLYLRNIDCLSSANLHVLKQFLNTVKDDLMTKGQDNAVGIILSVSNKRFVNTFDLHDWVKEHTLELVLPDLTERREDLRDLVSFFIKEYTLSIEFDFTEHAWRLLEAFNWRDNVEQLKRVIQRAATIAEGPHISVSLLEPLLKD